MERRSRGLMFDVRKRSARYSYSNLGNDQHVGYEYLVGFKDNWKICLATSIQTSSPYYCVFCPCDCLRTYMFPNRNIQLFNHCETHSIIPDVVLATLNM